jgi:hypothetical protein
MTNTSNRKNMKTKDIIILAAIPLIVSCARQELPLPEEGRKVSVEVGVGFSDATSTRSSVGSSASLDSFESALKDITVFQFEKVSGSYHLSGSYYADLTGSSSLKVSGLSGRGYRFYGLLNCGDRRSSLTSGAAESALQSLSVDWPVGSRSLSGGMPMSCGPVDATLSYGSTLNLSFTRLPSRLDFRINQSFSHGSFEIESLRIRQSPTVTSPFAASNAFTTSQPSLVSDGDYASASDLSLLAGGSSVRYYSLENACGKIISNTASNPKLKVPDSGTSVGGYLPTYLELTGTYTDLSGGLVSANTYRMYLGENATDNFNVARGTRYTLTLNLSDDGGFLDDYWKIEPDVTDSRTFRFASSTYYIPGNGSASVSVTGNSSHYGITYSLSSSLTGVGFNSSTLTLSQGSYTSQRTGTLTARYWDGRIADQCTVVARAKAVDVSPIGMVDIETDWTSSGFHKQHPDDCTLGHGEHNSLCTLNHTRPWEDDYIDVDDCTNRIAGETDCPYWVLVPSGGGQVTVKFSVAANYRVDSSGNLTYDILTPGVDYELTRYELLTRDGEDSDDSVNYADPIISGNTVTLGAQFQSEDRTHWYVTITPTSSKLDTEERTYVVSTGGSEAMTQTDVTVSYGKIEKPFEYTPSCSESGRRVWMIADDSIVEFENDDDPDLGNSFSGGHTMLASVNTWNATTKVYAIDKCGVVRRTDDFTTQRYTCDIYWHGYFTDPIKASRLRLAVYSGFRECLLPLEVYQYDVFLTATLDGKRTVLSTMSQSYFKLDSDDYTIEATLYDQTEYDSYEWDADLLIGTDSTQLTLSVAADGSWTLE